MQLLRAASLVHSSREILSVFHVRLSRGTLDSDFTVGVTFEGAGEAVPLALAFGVPEPELPPLADFCSCT